MRYRNLKASHASLKPFVSIGLPFQSLNYYFVLL